MNTITVKGYYNVNDRTQKIADASPLGLGAVLIQFDEKGSKIISYGSRSLTSVERSMHRQKNKLWHWFGA